MNINLKAYWPAVVSFGPYHHGKEHLKPMEEHKARDLRHFIKRSNEPSDHAARAGATVCEVLPNLMACYHLLDQKGQNDKDAFLQIMILDGCFILEIDMLKLENQLPILVLEKLVAVERKTDVLERTQSNLRGELCSNCVLTKNRRDASFRWWNPFRDWNFRKGFESLFASVQDEEVINKLILEFCCPLTTIVKMGECLHVLDVFWKRLVHKGPSHKTSNRKSYMAQDGYEIVRSATDLIEAGIKF
ncbi:hypothetical protein CRG98_014005 [Punica granatum]|nr:hypothetical protein CRG98_014005 [Punica granatum]